MKKIILVQIIILLVFSVAASSDSDISTIKKRIVKELLKIEVDDGQIADLIETIKEDGSWPGINYENVFRTNYEHSKHINNLVALSKSFKNPSSSFYKNMDAKSCFNKAIDFWNEHDFIADNWHTNEIANPKKWNAILFLMENELSKEQTEALVKMAGRANFNSWGARPGGDQIKIAGIAAELAIFLNDEETLSEAVRIMANEIQISSGNGIKPDLAFHHRVDRVTSILSYGTGYAGAFADWAVRLSGTKYNFPEETTKLVIDFYLDGICKSMVHGKSKDPGAMNRGISRIGYVSLVNASIPEKLSKASDYRKDELENIVRIRNGEQKPNLTNNKFFWHSEYHSHQRLEYFTSVRMHSERNHNMEYPHNFESLKMHHYADGSNFISITGKEYYDIFSVWDWQKIPGTTVVQKDKHPSYREIVKWGKTDFVGGITDGIYGSA
ncbi:MAG: polysaccharide lyase family 8 super-sandwich domain-containing protein, partial [Draconibacterium sp.]|nr:polysaccharide lyase family 8 super-sandwich domain-containing protein [Draconibacterium sp.]